MGQSDLPNSTSNSEAVLSHLQAGDPETQASDAIVSAASFRLLVWSLEGLEVATQFSELLKANHVAAKAHVPNYPAEFLSTLDFASIH